MITERDENELTKLSYPELYDEMVRAAAYATKVVRTLTYRIMAEHHPSVYVPERSIVLTLDEDDMTEDGDPVLQTLDVVVASPVTDIGLDVE